MQQTADRKVTRSHRFVSVQREFQTTLPWGSIKGHRFNLEHLWVIYPESERLTGVQRSLSIEMESEVAEYLPVFVAQGSRAGCSYSSVVLHCD